MDQFCHCLGEANYQRLRLVVMDMWKAFEKSTRQRAPQTAILYDKFHVIRHLGEALDTVRKQEYAHLTGKDRSFSKGQKCTLLSYRQNLSLTGRQALKKLLKANQRLNVAYVLKESFSQVWDYRGEG